MARRRMIPEWEKLGYDSDEEARLEIAKEMYDCDDDELDFFLECMPMRRND